MITRFYSYYYGGSESGIDITTRHETTSMNKLTIEYWYGDPSARWVSGVKCLSDVELS